MPSQADVHPGQMARAAGKALATRKPRPSAPRGRRGGVAGDRIPSTSPRLETLSGGCPATTAGPSWRPSRAPARRLTRLARHLTRCSRAHSPIRPRAVPRLSRSPYPRHRRVRFCRFRRRRLSRLPAPPALSQRAHPAQSPCLRLGHWFRPRSAGPLFPPDRLSGSTSPAQTRACSRSTMAIGSPSPASALLTCMALAPFIPSHSASIRARVRSSSDCRSENPSLPRAATDSRLR